MARQKKYRQAKFVQSLYEYDGPKLVLLKTPGTSYIIGAAVYKPDLVAPFYGAEVSPQQIYELLSNEYGVRYLFLKPKHRSWFLFDLADLDHGEGINLMPLKLTSETAEYLPGRKFFASDFTEEISAITGPQPKAEERIYVAGNWEISDFNDLYGVYSDLYSFNDGIEKFLDKHTAIDTKRTVREAFRKQWQGGGSYGSFYKTLRTVQSHSERLTLGGFEYHSPGWVDIEGKAEKLSAVTDMLRDFNERYVEITAAYNGLYKYLQENKLLSLAAEDFEPSTSLAANVAERGEAFSLILPAAPWGIVLELADSNPLVASKVLLSLHRRLARINDFQLQGRVTI